jgi:hypothetical protein
MPKILFIWGGSILGIGYLILAAGWMIDAYIKSGWVGVAAVAVVVSAIPSLVIAVIVQERADSRRTRRYRERP